MDFEKEIKEWVQLDNKIKMANQQVKELRDKRTDIGTTILRYVETNQLENRPINISDGQLRFGNTNVQQGLTYQFLHQTLLDILPEEKVDQIIQYIKQKRVMKQQLDIKRCYKNE